MAIRTVMITRRMEKIVLKLLKNLKLESLSENLDLKKLVFQ